MLALDALFAPEVELDVIVGVVITSNTLLEAGPALYGIGAGIVCLVGGDKSLKIVNVRPFHSAVVSYLMSIGAVVMLLRIFLQYPEFHIWGIVGSAIVLA